MPEVLETLSILIPVFSPEEGYIILLLSTTALFLVYYFRTKQFFFIRHGSTVLNEMHIKQGIEGRLSEKGIAQTKQMGKYLANFRIKKILASPFKRTSETAEIIQKYLKVPIEYSPLLQERRNPSEILGKEKYDSEVKKVVGAIELSYHNDGFRYSDEENFNDLKERSKKCLNFLERQWPSRICVVTHSSFLKILLSYILYRKDLHVSEYVKLNFFNEVDSGKVTVCEYSPWKSFFSKNRGWSIVSYNE